MNKLITLLMAFLLLNCYSTANASEKNKQWLEDINFYVKQVKSIHIKPFHTLTEAQFDHKVAKLKKALPTLSEVEIETRLAGITAALADGHSNYFMMSGPHQHYPFRFKFFDNKLKIIAASQEHKALVGHELISINDFTVSELYQTLSNYLPGVDNQYSQRTRFEFYITLEKLLRGLGVVTEGEAAKFVTNNHGKINTVSISPVSMGAFNNVSSPYETRYPKIQLASTQMKGIDWAIIQENVAYFRFHHYPKFEEVLENCDQLQDQLKASKATKLIIDFRNNDGGSFYTGLAFSACLQPLHQFDWLNGVVLLTNGRTFSAAMSNTVQFKQIFNATIIGEPTGGDPSAFSESYRFELPNSKRKLSLSVRYYPFIEGDSDAIYPDITVKPTWEAYQQGSDTVLLNALAFLNDKTN